MDRLVKRLLAVLLTALMVCSAGPMGLIEANATDIPTGYTPIYTAQDLDNIRINLTGYYYLMNDIDLASWGNWEPIGTYGEPFQGILLGNGHAIQNLSIKNDDLLYAGLFGLSAGVAMNLLLENATIQINNSSIGNDSMRDVYVGGIAGYGYVIQCGVKGNYDVSSIEPAQIIVGGLVGGGDVSQSYFSGTIAVNNPSGYGCLGGIVGGGKVNDCYSRGSLTGNYGFSGFCGGIFGRAGEAKNCFSICQVSVTESIYPNIPTYASYANYTGGIAGAVFVFTDDYMLQNCYYLNDVASAAYGYEYGYTYLRKNNVLSLTAAQMKQQTNYTGFDFSATWEMPNGEGHPILRGLPSQDSDINVNINTTTLTDIATGVIVEGVLPNDIALVVSRNNALAVEDTQDLLAGYDITLQVNGQPVQPSGTVTVKIPVPAGVSDNSKLKVYRFEPNGSQTDMGAAVEGGYLVFTTEHFSYYGVVYESGQNKITIAPANGLVVADFLTVNGKTVKAYYQNHGAAFDYNNDNASLANAKVDTFGLSCASLVKRYYMEHFKIEVKGLLVNSNPYTDDGGSFEKVLNPNQPQIGDVVSMKGLSGQFGEHWALVKSVDDSGNVTIIEQN